MNIQNWKEFNKINENASATENDFDKVVELLRETTIKANLKLVNNEIVIELGWNYKDSIYDKIYDKLENEISMDNVSISAQEDGGIIIKSARINGGVRRS